MARPKPNGKTEVRGTRAVFNNYKDSLSIPVINTGTFCNKVFVSKLYLKYDMNATRKQQLKAKLADTNLVLEAAKKE